ESARYKVSGRCGLVEHAAHWRQSLPRLNKRLVSSAARSTSLQFPISVPGGSLWMFAIRFKTIRQIWVDQGLSTRGFLLGRLPGGPFRIRRQGGFEPARAEPFSGSIPANMDTVMRCVSIVGVQSPKKTGRLDKPCLAINPFEGRRS